MTKNNEKQVLVAGGGAAGMMAAITAAEAGAAVTLFERNDRLGKKLRITGKGRCNLTNACDRDTFFENIPTNPKFLYAAYAAFAPEDTMAFFEGLGVELKVERGRRVFPASDRAQDIVSALENRMREVGVKVVPAKVKQILSSDGRATGFATSRGDYFADAVILATGGKSYPLTGSDGSGYAIAREAGHTILAPTPSLVPLTSPSKVCQKMQGLSLKNVSLRLAENATGKAIFEDFGEMLFTHFGLSGPLVLSASAHLQKREPNAYTIHIDLKPALDEKTLDARIVSDFSKYKNRDFCNALSDLLPEKMILPMIENVGIDPRKKVNTVTREERERLVGALKDFVVPISGARPIDEAIITRGGVSTKEINPKTMESKLLSGLYFAGEIIDVDAYTGGFNLQIAFSTARLAGAAAAE